MHPLNKIGTSLQIGQRMLAAIAATPNFPVFPVSPWLSCHTSQSGVSATRCAAALHMAPCIRASLHCGLTVSLYSRHSQDPRWNCGIRSVFSAVRIAFSSPVSSVKSVVKDLQQELSL